MERTAQKWKVRCRILPGLTWYPNCVQRTWKLKVNERELRIPVLAKILAALPNKHSKQADHGPRCLPDGTAKLSGKMVKAK